MVLSTKSRTTRAWIFIGLSNVLLPIALFVFATGFFPYKAFLPGHAILQSQTAGSAPISAPFNKVIFMVVDALRSDFVYGPEAGFQFAQRSFTFPFALFSAHGDSRLIADGSAIPFTAHAASPTITMPRIKAITTGSVPSFLDLILNFFESDTTSSLANQDSWLLQLKNLPDGKLVMYGDDTWLKLFPSTFDRADGTTSFFVSDFTEVDNNVTRHLSTELENDDWNGLILHYLGLDHIGHKSGPRSPHMYPKQSEMDAIFQQLFQYIETRESLQDAILILCGDHGMNDAGNHGGSSEGETSPALLFASPKLQQLTHTSADKALARPEGFDFYDLVDQSDITPTLAGLMGFPIPLNNLGAFIPNFLGFWPKRTQVEILLRNAEQMMSVVKSTFVTVDFDAEYTDVDCASLGAKGDMLSCLWSDARSGIDTLDSSKSIVKLQTFCKEAQQILSSTASNYNMPKMHVGIAIMTVALFLLLDTAFQVVIAAPPKRLLIICLTLSYCLMAFGSSYIEEEQTFWYWSSSAWLLWLIVKRRNMLHSSPQTILLQVICSLTLFRIISAWNSTGQKHPDLPDIARSFLPQHIYLMWLLISATYLEIFWSLYHSIKTYTSGPTSLIGSVLLISLASLYKVAFTLADAPELLQGIDIPIYKIPNMSLVSQARAIYLGIGILLAFDISGALISTFTTKKPQDHIYRSQTLHHLLTLILVTQTRANNIPVFLAFRLLYSILQNYMLSGDEIYLTILLLQHAAFFSLGGSNSIASIDLASAYNVVKGYNAVAVGLLTFIGNWAGPVWWVSASALLSRRSRTPRKPSYRMEEITLATLFVIISVLAMMLACTMLRAHLFIWTVFSPRYLYSIAWGVGQHLCISIGLGSVLHQIY